MIQVEQAEKLIRPLIFKTPLIHSPSLSRKFGGEIFLKLENLQKTGSFKIRGAAYKIMKQSGETGGKGIVAASAGNHAQGVALAATEAGVEATIVMPEWASISKQEATRSYGGKVVIYGTSIGKSLEKARELSQSGATFIHPFDDADIISGQGTIALEIFRELKDPDIIMVPIGGGGLISGIAAAARQIKPDVRIVGVQAAACPSAFESLRAGQIVQVPSKSSIADGISVKKVGAINFEIIRRLVDEIVLADEQQIAAAILMLLERKKILAEGAGAVSLAALLSGSIAFPKGRKVVLVISGGNVDSPLLGRIIAKGLINNGRIVRLRVRLIDMPGSLSRLLGFIADLKANVLHIHHDRGLSALPISMSGVEIEIETRSSNHIQEICHRLKDAGYEIEKE